MKRLDFIIQRYLLANVFVLGLCGIVWWAWISANQSLTFWAIIGWTMLFFVLLSSLIFWIHQKATHQLRRYFHQIYHKLEGFDFDSDAKVQFSPSPITELDELSQNLNELMNRLHDNYRTNKQFTQNAAHELQTPLMIIKANAELLIQSPKLGKGEMETIANILTATTRLSKLNSALILLSKIEYGRFIDTELLVVETIMNSILANFKDSIQLQGLTIKKQYQANLTVEMSAALLEILIANLIQNAIRHNIEKGFIQITIGNDFFMIENTGKPLKHSPQKLFERFRRESDLEESLGLGLSIVKRICEQYHFEVVYTCSEENIHRLAIHV